MCVWNMDLKCVNTPLSHVTILSAQHIPRAGGHLIVASQGLDYIRGVVQLGQ